MHAGIGETRIAQAYAEGFHGIRNHAGVQARQPLKFGWRKASYAHIAPMPVHPKMQTGRISKLTKITGGKGVVLLGKQNGRRSVLQRNGDANVRDLRRQFRLLMPPNLWLGRNNLVDKPERAPVE